MEPRGHGGEPPTRCPRVLAPREGMAPPPKGSAPSHVVTTVTIRFTENPLRDFKVKSNFSSVQGADKKVEGTLRALVNPVLEGLRVRGFSFTFGE